MKEKEVLSKLKSAFLHDNDSLVRLEIIQLIAILNDTSMIQTLTKLVNRDDDPEIIQTASTVIQILQGVTPLASLDF